MIVFYIYGQWHSNFHIDFFIYIYIYIYTHIYTYRTPYCSGEVSLLFYSDLQLIG